MKRYRRLTESPHCFPSHSTEKIRFETDIHTSNRDTELQRQWTQSRSSTHAYYAMFFTFHFMLYLCTNVSKIASIVKKSGHLCLVPIIHHSFKHPYVMTGTLTIMECAKMQRVSVSWVCVKGVHAQAKQRCKGCLHLSASVEGVHAKK